MDIQFGFQSFNSGSVPPSPIPPDPIPLTYANVGTVKKLLFVPDYDNGSAGVGATLTATQNGYISDGSSTGKIDYNYVAQVGDIILVKNEAFQLRNGLYEVVDTGSSTTPYQLVRSPENDISAELYPLQVNVLFGQSQNLRFYIQTTVNPIIGISPLVFALSAQQGFTNPLTFVDTATSSALPSCVYASGANPSLPGVGATLTATDFGALGTINGLTATTNTNLTTGFTKILVKDEANQAYNGTYLVTSAGNSTTRWKLTRIDNTNGGFYRYTRYFLVSNTGSTLAGKYYFTTPTNPPLTNATIGTANLQILEYGGTTSGVVVGENYVVVYAGDDWVANGVELRNALATAETLTPNGAAISPTNRVTIICYPGYYDVASNLNFRETIDDYIDLVSITGNCDVNLVEISGSPTGQPIIVNSIDNNFVGINCGNGAFVIDNRIGQTATSCLNCKGGDFSFGSGRLSSSPFQLVGTFENCTGGDESFGGGSSGTTPLSARGNYINCVGGNYSFGTNGDVTATFENCTAGRGSFGSLCSSLENAKFINCTADITSFGFNCNDILNCYFENCKGDDNCFGNYFGITSTNIQAATFINCESGNLSFGVDFNGDSQFTFTNCIGKDNCFGYAALATGGNQIINCYNCIANNYSFQYLAPSNYYNCTGNDYCFQDSGEISSGLYVNCKAHGYSFGAVSGRASGLYKYCIAGESCFASGVGTGTLSGKLYYCQMDFTAFNLVTIPGRTFYCVGNDIPNNQ